MADGLFGVAPDVHAGDGNRVITRILFGKGKLSVSTTRDLGAIHWHSDNHLSAHLGKNPLEPSFEEIAPLIAGHLHGIHHSSSRVDSIGTVVHRCADRARQKASHSGAPSSNDLVPRRPGYCEDAGTEAYSVTSQSKRFSS